MEIYHDVYISYGHQYRQEATELAIRLKDEGFNVWIDIWNLKSDSDLQNWTLISRRALERTNTVLVLIGSRGISPRGQTEELEIILSTPGLKIIPVLLPGASPNMLPNSLFNYIYADLRPGFTDTRAMSDLISAISPKRRTTSEPPDYPSNPSQSVSSTGNIIIKIKPHDTLSDIAREYGVTIEEILELNPQIKLKNFFMDRNELIIPAKGSYAENLSTVQEAASTPDSESTSAPPESDTTSAVYEEGWRQAPQESELPERVLNAGFSDAEGILEPDQALESDRPYQFLVDVGPVWVDISSLVTKSEKVAFPERYLPEEKEGYIVQTVFVSEDFKPHISSAAMWVPVKDGQSYPYVNGKRAKSPEPTRLTVRTPHLGRDQKEMRAFGRLCLYHKGQLIQSAQVSVGIAHEARIKLDEPNKIDIDYVLTSDMRYIGEEVGERRVKIQAGEDMRPVSVNLTLNEDGSGNHRILATYHLDSKEEISMTSAWGPYDPQYAKKVLNESRNAIASCYENLDENFGKSRKYFGYDMLKLARIGNRLRALALSDLDVSGTDMTVASWKRELFNAMKSATVIQISRTGPAQYVFPWAFIYDYPMPGHNEKFAICKILNEWTADGIRTKDAGMSCPYQEEDWHQENIICPYGFWGLKHIIEQPKGGRKADGSFYLDATDKTFVGEKIEIGMGVTFDIDKAAVNKHVASLVAKMNAQLEPHEPVYNNTSVRDMLRAPEFVYFLCHGETDTDETPYISIGNQVKKPDYMISPLTLDEWHKACYLDDVVWQKKRPLVFINGCHTAQLKPGVALNFVTPFADLGASGVIGTEVSVRADMAMAIAEAIFVRVAEGMELGQAVREMRWEMLNRGNLLGLAYTQYSLANLHIQRRN